MYFLQYQAIILNTVSTQISEPYARKNSNHNWFYYIIFTTNCHVKYKPTNRLNIFFSYFYVDLPIYVMIIEIAGSDSNLLFSTDISYLSVSLFYIFLT